MGRARRGLGRDLGQPEQAQPRQGPERLGAGRGREVQMERSGESSRGGDPTDGLDICPRTSSEAACARPQLPVAGGSAWKGGYLSLKGNEGLAEGSSWNVWRPPDTHVSSHKRPAQGPRETQAMSAGDTRGPRRRPSGGWTGGRSKGAVARTAFREEGGRAAESERERERAAGRVSGLFPGFRRSRLYRGASTAVTAELV